jgi:hypothetical protein
VACNLAAGVFFPAKRRLLTNTSF